MPDIIFSPIIPLPAFIVTALLSGIVLGYQLFCAPRIGLLRGLSIVLFLALLADPKIQDKSTESLNDVVIILHDESKSQSIDGRAEASAKIVDALEQNLDQLENVESQTISVGSFSESNLWRAYNAAVSSVSPKQLAGVFLVTDGQPTDAIDNFSPPKDMPPVYVLLDGRKNETDRKITLLTTPKYGIVNETVELTFRVDDVGENDVALPDSGPINVELRVNGAVITRETVPLNTKLSLDVPITVRGKTIVELFVPEMAGELTTENNSAIITINSIQDRLRVLLISGEPHAGERAWRNLLKSDPAIDLVHFTILRPVEKAQSDNALERELALIEFPYNELFIEKIREFDLLIFDRYTYRGVLNAFHFDNIARYIESGGAVLISSGPEYNGFRSLASRRNLSFVLPALPAGAAQEGPFRVQKSMTGKVHPITQGLAEADYWGRWLRYMPIVSRSGQKLLETPSGEPVLIIDRVGEGRIALFLSDHFWLWARGFDGGGPYGELLRRVSHWLMKEPDLEEEKLELVASDNQLSVERRTLSDSAEPTVLTAPDGTTSNLTLAPTQNETLKKFTVQDPVNGIYRVRSGDLFDIEFFGDNSEREMRNVVMTDKKLESVVKGSNGKFLRVRTGDRIDVPSIRKVRSVNQIQPGNLNSIEILSRQAKKTLSIKQKRIASPLIWLCLLAASILGAWHLEGRTR